LGLSLLFLALGSTQEEGTEGSVVSDGTASVPGETADPHASALAEISREMMRLYKEQFGRGPTKARTSFAGPNAVLCTLEDSLTPAEHRLAEMNEHQRLRDVRLFFQHASEPQLCAIVETALNRKVRAFISGIDTRSDVSAEVFYLEPVGTPLHRVGSEADARI
jgi:uncharacterized protein YbcI